MEAVRQSTVSAQVSGRIVDIRFDVGDRVQKGDVILRIDERAASQAVAASEAQVREAEATLVNARAQLRAHETARRAEVREPGRARQGGGRLQGRRVAHEGHPRRRRRRRHREELHHHRRALWRRRLRAPCAAGRDGLARQAAPHRLRPLVAAGRGATVASAQVAAIQAGAKARIEVPSLDRWVEVKSITVVPSADPRTHTTQVRLDLPDDAKGLLPGVFARAHFVTGKCARLMVPRAAVLHRSEVTAVYVIDEKGAPRLRQVRSAPLPTRSRIEVLAGPQARRESRSRAGQGRHRHRRGGLAAPPWASPGASRATSRIRNSRR